MGQFRPLFLLIFVFNMLQFKIQIDKRVDGVLVIRTRGGRWKAKMNPLSYSGTPSK